MSSIEWTEKTWNPVIGCTPVSPGCLNCYAATMARRMEAMGTPEYGVRFADLPTDRPPKEIRIAEVRGGRAVFTGEVRCLDDRLTIPLQRRKPTMWFVNSMSDLFHESVPFEFIDKVFAVMALCPQHTFQVLTKRPERMAEYLTRRRVIYDGFSRKFGPSSINKTPCDDVYTIVRQHKGHERDDLMWPLANVWLGASVENQQTADERIPHLLRCPAAVRFLSCEPLLGQIDLPSAVVKRRIGDPQPDWVIVGGESGAKARPCDVAWIRGIVRQCRDAGVPCFVKQLGARPSARCSNCGLDVEDSEACGPSHAVLLAELVAITARKGNNPAEWPSDLRVREWPRVVSEAEAARSKA